MPELPEVENFRTLLLPLVSSEEPLRLERCSLDKKPPRKFMEDSEIAEINQGNYYLSEVIRKGKLIAMVLVQQAKTEAKTTNPAPKYLLIHMGMTGRISTPTCVPQLESLTVNDYPPPHTYLQFRSGTNEASFSDPRKFGFIQVTDSIQDSWEGLAPDAWLDLQDDSTKSMLIEKMAFQSMGIKAMLLDQKRILSGVGNWVADEVLYQTQIHPDQNYLTLEQAQQLLETLHSILSTAISCLVETKTEFPKEWLFHYRWNGKKTTKDAQGRVVSFVTSGGRTSAVVPSIQQKKAGQKRPLSSENESTGMDHPSKSKRQRNDSKPSKMSALPPSTKSEEALPAVVESNTKKKVTTKAASTKKSRTKSVKPEVTSENDNVTRRSTRIRRA